MSADARRHRIVDKVKRISRARVLGDLVGVEIELPGLRIDDYILEDRAEANRVPDLRFALPGKADAFCIAAAFEVENAAIAPAVFVVADQPTGRVGRKRCFAGAGE